MHLQDICHSVLDNDGRRALGNGSLLEYLTLPRTPSPDRQHGRYIVPVS